MAKYEVSTLSGTFECDDGEYILDAAEANDIELNYSCRAGACTSCLCFTENKHNIDGSDQSFLSDEWLEVGFFLSCVARPTGDVSFVECDEDVYNIMKPPSVFSNGSSDGQQMWHYFFGYGTPMLLDFNIRNSLEYSDRQLEAEANIQAGTTDMSGNYAVDLTFTAYGFSIGRTGVHYRTRCDGGMCTTTFTGFVRASGSTILGPDYYTQPLTYIGITGNLPGGTPFPYMPHIWTRTFPDPGYGSND